MPADSPISGAGYYALEPAQYHADPAPRPSLSSGVAALLLTKTPRQAWMAHPRLNPDFEDEDRKQFDLGSVAHELLLGKGSGIHVIDADDWRKQETKDERKQAIANGLQPCLAKVYEQADAMVKAAREQLADDPDNHDAFTNGRGELCMFWQEQCAPGKMWMRGMIDWLMADNRRAYDYKTFAPGADPEGFVKYLVGGGKDVQDPFYCRGIGAIEGVPWDEISFRFVVQDPEPPYLLSVVELVDRDWHFERSQWAIDRWAACAVAGAYRGFIPRTHRVSPPTWAMMAWEDRKTAEEAAERAIAEAA